MDLVSVNFIVKGEEVTELVNLSAIARVFENERGCFLGLVGEQYTKQISRRSFSFLINL